MKWKYETFEQAMERKKKWHRWFAWYPVKYNGNGFWLECCERTWSQIMSIGHGYWIYREITPPNPALNSTAHQSHQAELKVSRAQASEDS